MDEELLDSVDQGEVELGDLGDVERAYGEFLWAMEPLPPGLEWDYFAPLTYDLSDDIAELGDTENPAFDDVFDWGMPMIGLCRTAR